jgi:hypothetical protein
MLVVYCLENDGSVFGRQVNRYYRNILCHGGQVLYHHDGNANPWYGGQISCYQDDRLRNAELCGMVLQESGDYVAFVVCPD